MVAAAAAAAEAAVVVEDEVLEDHVVVADEMVSFMQFKFKNNLSSIDYGFLITHKMTVIRGGYNIETLH